MESDAMQAFDSDHVDSAAFREVDSTGALNPDLAVATFDDLDDVDDDLECASDVSSQCESSTDFSSPADMWNGGALVQHLPHLILDRIAKELHEYPDELMVLSLSCTAMRYNCRKYLSVYCQELRFPGLGLCTEYHCSDLLANDSPECDDEYPYHRLLWLILRGHIDPLFTHTVWLSEEADYHRFQKRNTREYSGFGRLGLSLATEQEQKEYDDLYRAAARPLFASSRLDHVCQAFREGSHDAALAVLLPQFRRIKVLETPRCYGASRFCIEVFAAVARLYKRDGIAGPKARLIAKQAAKQDLDAGFDAINARFARSTDMSALPFAELLILKVGEGGLYQSIHLEHILPYMGIPSLHRIVLLGRASLDGMPYPVRSYCPQMWVARSDVSLSTMMSLCDNLVSCDIRRHHSEGKNEWDHITVSCDDRGKRWTSIGLHFEDDVDHYWVDVTQGEMLDWRQLYSTWDEDDDDVGTAYSEDSGTYVLPQFGSKKQKNV